MNVIRRNFPNFLTCLNVLSGCVAIVFAFSPFEAFGSLAGWQCASLALAVAVLADFFDGFSARLLKAWSAMGKELDSLSDLVSFGVAPAMILLNVLAEVPGLNPFIPWCALFIPVTGALRLARFNVDTRQSSSFIGLPIPANAILWIGYVALVATHPEWEWLTAPWLVLPLILVAGWLMVSPLHLIALKFHDYKWRGNECRWILVAGSAVLIASLRMQAFIPVIVLYIVISLFAGKKN